MHHPTVPMLAAAGVALTAFAGARDAPKQVDRLPTEPAGDAAPAGAPGEITFANLPEWCDVSCKCRRCGHIDRLDRRALIARFGKRQSILALAPRMRCKTCENRDGNTIFIGSPDDKEEGAMGHRRGIDLIPEKGVIDPNRGIGHLRLADLADDQLLAAPSATTINGLTDGPSLESMVTRSRLMNFDRCLDAPSAGTRKVMALGSAGHTAKDRGCMCNRYRIEVEFDELWHAARPHRDMTNRANPRTEVFPDKRVLRPAPRPCETSNPGEPRITESGVNAALSKRWKSGR